MFLTMSVVFSPGFSTIPINLMNIVLQLKYVLRDEITNIIKSVFKDEIENYIKDSLHTVTNEIEVLILDNTMFDKSVGCRANDIGCVEGGGYCCVLGLVTCICEVKPL
jgi:hypothetical protein